MPILAFLGLSILDLGPMYATDRQTDVRQTDRQHHRLMPPPIRGGGIIMFIFADLNSFIRKRITTKSTDLMSAVINGNSSI